MQAPPIAFSPLALSDEQFIAHGMLKLQSMVCTVGVNIIKKFYSYYALHRPRLDGPPGRHHVVIAVGFISIMRARRLYTGFLKPVRKCGANVEHATSLQVEVQLETCIKMSKHPTYRATTPLFYVFHNY